jgi:peptidoglycan/xylan/chitin deacetylase (PgdA/CDA1 family)
MSPRSTTPKLAILAFHKIGDAPATSWNTWFYVPEATFADHLRHLHENGWVILDLQAFLRGLMAPDTLPERAALLTFDDGYHSLHDVALPWLVRFAYPAVIFVPTDFIGGHNTFDAGIEPDEAICGWDDLRALTRHAVSVQSHGASHRAFATLDPAEQAEELVRSKAVLEAGLGSSVELFSYPYGDTGTDPAAVRTALRQAGYRAAFLYGGGLNATPIDDPYGLARIAMGPDTDLAAVLRQA